MKAFPAPDLQRMRRYGICRRLHERQQTWSGHCMKHMVWRKWKRKWSRGVRAIKYVRKLIFERTPGRKGKRFEGYLEGNESRENYIQ